MLSELIRDAEQGEEVIIALDNVSVAKLVAIPQSKQRKPGTLKGKLKIMPGAFDPLSAAVLRMLGVE